MLQKKNLLNSNFFLLLFGFISLGGYNTPKPTPEWQIKQRIFLFLKSNSFYTALFFWFIKTFTFIYELKKNNNNL